MSTGSQKRTRSERVAALELPPRLWGRAFETLRRGDVLLRLGICLFAAVVMWSSTRAWSPPFPYHIGQVPQRSIVARANFEVENSRQTEKNRDEARRQARYVYKNDPEPLRQMLATLKGQVVQLRDAETYDEATAKIWAEFLPTEEEVAQRTPEEMFETFRMQLTGVGKLAVFERAVHDALADFEKRGLLMQLAQERNEGNQAEIFVYTGEADRRVVDVSQVRIGEAATEIKLNELLIAEDALPLVSNHVAAWLVRHKLPETLSVDEIATEQVKEDAAAAEKVVMTPFEAGKILATAGEPITAEIYFLLNAEREQMLAERSAIQWITRSLAAFGMYGAIFLLCGFYIHFRNHDVLRYLGRFIALISLAIATVTVGYWIGCFDNWRAGMVLIPLLLFGMIVAIVFQQEMALLFSSAAALVLVLSVGSGLASFVILMAGAATAVLLVGRIRSRTKLIYVGLCAGLVAALTTLGVSTVEKTLEISTIDGQSIPWQLLYDAALVGLWAVIAGFLMTGLLPFVERGFGVLTDISLLELGDAAHPLLQELVRRAPGTYNHSINVASIAEAAAESIGANGLLVRVGAYFHDIGKMLKPGYFIENQGQEANRHDELLPAMSTLIIIAHVKDGADLARQHHLPRSIIDFIQQHHGTTLVEFFYRRASEQQEADDNGNTVDENSYRYPGPKPQSRASGILMLADTVESASRVLVEPTPARIESLVHDLVMKRLLDGQLDESELTLQEVRAIEDSLVKSLIAVYHGRVKYPEQPQKTA
jgi:putative nucleotidyltransferase with HDIG domain